MKTISYKFKLRFTAAIVAVLLISALMLSLLFFQKLELIKPEKIMVRQISMIAPPPPPPPPPPAVQQAQSGFTPRINLTLSSSGAVMQFAKVKLANQINFTDISPPEISDMTSHLLDNLTVDWQAFGLDELDDMPRLLTNLKIKYPKSLVRKGVSSIAIELNVLIDESGKVMLRNIVQNPYPEFEPIIHKLMKKARFTAPKKNGVSVRAAFNWPLEFSHS